MGRSLICDLFMAADLDGGQIVTNIRNGKAIAKILNGFVGSVGTGIALTKIKFDHARQNISKFWINLRGVLSPENF